jgi:hypothetical protein
VPRDADAHRQARAMDESRRPGARGPIDGTIYNLPSASGRDLPTAFVPPCLPRGRWPGALLGRSTVLLWVRPACPSSALRPTSVARLPGAGSAGEPFGGMAQALH